MHRAVDIIGREAGSFWWNLLFPGKDAAKKEVFKPKTQIPSFFNKKIQENKEQRLAVRTIQIHIFEAYLEAIS